MNARNIIKYLTGGIYLEKLKEMGGLLTPISRKDRKSLAEVQKITGLEMEVDYHPVDERKRSWVETFLAAFSGSPVFASYVDVRFKNPSGIQIAIANEKNIYELNKDKFRVHLGECIFVKLRPKDQPNYNMIICPFESSSELEKYLREE